MGSTSPRCPTSRCRRGPARPRGRAGQCVPGGLLQCWHRPASTQGADRARARGHAGGRADELGRVARSVRCAVRRDNSGGSDCHAGHRGTNGLLGAHGAGCLRLRQRAHAIPRRDLGGAGGCERGLAVHHDDLVVRRCGLPCSLPRVVCPAHACGLPCQACGLPCSLPRASPFGPRC